MFNKTEYKLLIQQYMEKYNISYTTAKQFITIDKIKNYMDKNEVSYAEASLFLSEFKP